VDTTAPGTYVSVRLNPVGRALTFLLTEGDAPALGTPVVVRTDQGPSVGTVVPTVAALGPRRAGPHAAIFLRRATTHDAELRARQIEREQEARRSCLLKIRDLRLEMKLSRVEQLFDGSRLVFYFTAEGRVDFRELVRQLAAEFHTRIEMRQIGVRDEARMLGGFGSCGRPLCCSTWLQTFDPISIRMAKQQDLALNPSKLSGLCGRLKCCLRYELPNAKGQLHGGCGDEGACSNPTGPGVGSCGSCGSGAGGCGSGSCGCGR
jgi:cell fate regulator YaaT (PSP1 superfamily)